MVAIPKSGNPLHIKENAGCLGWELAKEDIERLRHA
jgi:diketogulonate reductase-like aldo/keto reductase